MAGNKEGGRSAAAKNKALYGDDFYKRIGQIGGSRSRTGGFHVNRDLARTAGALGGAKSIRPKAGSGRDISAERRRRRREIQKTYEHLQKVREAHLREKAKSAV